jgi:hypothetical protein
MTDSIHYIYSGPQTVVSLRRDGDVYPLVCHPGPVHVPACWDDHPLIRRLIARGHLRPVAPVPSLGQTGSAG